MRKRLAFLDTSFDDLRTLLESSRQEIGCQLDRIQQELNPYDWKLFLATGPDVREIHAHNADRIYHVIYIAKLEEAVHVLHYFQKKT